MKASEREFNEFIQGHEGYVSAELIRSEWRAIGRHCVRPNDMHMKMRVDRVLCVIYSIKRMPTRRNLEMQLFGVMKQPTLIPVGNVFRQGRFSENVVRQYGMPKRLYTKCISHAGPMRRN